MEEQIGIKQIAKLANVSIGTVDRVLHKRPGVSKATADRVLKIIKETGYKKNKLASRLKLAVKNRIKVAVLIPEIKNELSYWNLPKKGIDEAVQELSELGIQADYFYFNLDGAAMFEKLSTQVIAQEFSAIITVPFFKEACEYLQKEAVQKEIPIVFLDTEIALDSPGNFIRQNSFDAGKVAARLLHKIVDDGQYVVVKIANEREILSNSTQREKGFKAYFESLTTKNITTQTLNFNPDKGFEDSDLAAKIFKTQGKKGVFVTNAKSFLLPSHLESLGATATSLVGFDLNEQNLNCLQEEQIDFLINQQPEYQGYAAIKGLFQFLTEKDNTNLNINIPIEIIVKENLQHQLVPKTIL